MAVIITLVIVSIASVKNSKIKALIYSLPIPITVALFTTNVNIDYSHILGLFLLNAFLWSVFCLYKILKIPILLSDIFCSLGYIFLGYIFVNFFPLDFWVVCVFYFIAWITYIINLRQIKESGTRNNLIAAIKTPLLIKAGIVFFIALFLLSLKSFLYGVIVTFPFSGVFAVWEIREDIYTLAREFTKNSFAILIFFIVIKIFSPYIGFFPSIGLGWLVYIPIIFGLQKIKS